MTQNTSGGMGNFDGKFRKGRKYIIKLELFSTDLNVTPKAPEGRKRGMERYYGMDFWILG